MIAIAQKLNPTNRYDRANGPRVPWGYKRSEFDPQLLEPIDEQLEALELGMRYLKMSSYPEVARWLTDYTGRRITPMGLWKRVKRDASDRRRHVEQKRRAAQTAAQGNIQTQDQRATGTGETEAS